jgi:hypothetical protein
VAPDGRHEASDATGRNLRDADRAILIIFGVYMAIAPSFPFLLHGFLVGARRVFLFDAAYSRREACSRARAVHVSREAMSAPFSIEPDC